MGTSITTILDKKKMYMVPLRSSCLPFELKQNLVFSALPWLDVVQNSQPSYYVIH